jgi:uncharacterized protein YegL
MANRPGGETAKRPLHFIWLADCSGSMKGPKIQTLNVAIHEAIPHMRSNAAQNPHAQVLVRAIRFATGAQWHIRNPTPVDDFKWLDLTADGYTCMGEALTMVADVLQPPLMENRAFPPVLALVTDGQPTDDFNAGLKAVLSRPWGQKAVRVAIGIGEDVDYEVLEKFIGNPEIRPLQANNPESLVQYIRWVSTEVLKSASTPATGKPPTPAAAAAPGPRTAIPGPPAVNMNAPDDW